MNYFDRIQSAIDYIESLLTSEINLEDVADQACFSLYHFHKIFHAITQNSIKEYIRKRRLTEAAYELVNTDRRIIEIAFDYQYQSQEAFTRAFKKMFGTTPRKYREKKEHYVLLQKKKLTESRLKHLNGGIALEPKIMNKDEFKIIGMKYYGANQNNEIPNLWGDFSTRITEIQNRVNSGVTMGLCEYVPNLTDESKFSYIACVEVDALVEIPDGMVGKIVSTNQYAVFTHKGPAKKLGETYEYIYGNWLLKSDYEPIEAHDFELYDQRFTDDENSEMEIFIPIRKLKNVLGG